MASSIIRLIYVTLSLVLQMCWIYIVKQHRKAPEILTQNVGVKGYNENRSGLFAYFYQMLKQ
jgi:hypothetical protein